jgi:hypothetical protein
VTSSSHEYPDFAGIGLFIQSAAVSQFPDAADAVLGDCITVSGKVGEFNGNTQLSNVTAYARDSGCGVEPEPLLVALADIASTTPSGTPGLSAETDEGIVVTIENVEASEASVNGDFIADDFAGSSILISNFFMTTTPVVAFGDQFSSITGVLTEFDDNTTGTVRYEIEPRVDAELVR